MQYKDRASAFKRVMGEQPGFKENFAENLKKFRSKKSASRADRGLATGDGSVRSTLFADMGKKLREGKGQMQELRAEFKEKLKELNKRRPTGVDRAKMKLVGKKS